MTNPNHNAILAALLAEANLAAETGEDMTVSVKGGGGKLWPKGRVLCRLVEYIEFGSQPQIYQGVAKDAAPSFSLAFEIYSPNHINDDGTPAVIRPYDIALSRNEKARAFLLFKSLNYKQNCTHFAQLLGHCFIGEIVHTENKDNKADFKPKSSLDLKAFLPPNDLMTGAAYPVPEPTAPYKLFLWERPNIDTFDTFFVEGQYEAQGGKPARSKNFIQDKMLSAVDFTGSPLEQLLMQHQRKYVIPAKVAPAVGAPAAAAIAATGMVMPSAIPAPAAAAPAVNPLPWSPDPVVAPPVAAPLVAPVMVAPVLAPVVAPTLVLPQ